MIYFSLIINQGITSIVYQCLKEETNEVLAAAYYHQNQDNLHLFRKEVFWLQLFEHPAIIKMKDYYFQNDVKIVFLEQCKCDLFDYIESHGILTMKEIKSKMKPIFEAVSLIHHHNAAHCDIKTENIGIIEDSNFKLIDFGSCSSIEENQDNHSGSFLYHPPEIITTSRNLQKGDIWSLGITLFACSTGQFPFGGDDMEYLDQVVNGEPDLSIFEYDEEHTDFVSLLRGMLSKSANNRFSIDDCFSHPFFL
jgi:serine/threonine protein kinase